MPAPAFRLEGLVKSYGGRRVLDLESLEVDAGSVWAIVGPSGAGKTTLLRLLNGLEKPDAGRIWFFGQELTAANGLPALEVRRRMTMVFQTPVLFTATVAENVAYGLRVRGVDQGSVARRVARALDLVGLAGTERRGARSLSAGEAQRVSLARALVVEPEVLLLDEPTANLDPANAAIIESLLRRASGEMGVTVVLVTHNLFQARRVADHTGFLLDGRLVETGPTREFFERPADPRTRAFIRGEMVF